MSELETCAICESPIYGKKNVRNGVTIHAKQTICKEVIGLRMKESRLEGEREGYVKALDDVQLRMHYQLSGAPLPSDIDGIIKQLKSDYLKEVESGKDK